MKICTNLNIRKIIKTPLVRAPPSKSQPHHWHRPIQSRLETPKEDDLKRGGTTGALHGLMRNKFRCVKVGEQNKGTRSSDVRYDEREMKDGAPERSSLCGVHANVMRRAQISGAEDEYYFEKALLDYEAKYRVPFGWILKFQSLTEKKMPRDTRHLDLAVERPMGMDKAKGLKKKGARVSGSSSSMNEEALTRLMVSELEMYNERSMAMKKEEHLTFLEIGSHKELKEVVDKGIEESDDDDIKEHLSIEDFSGENLYSARATSSSNTEMLQSDDPSGSNNELLQSDDPIFELFEAGWHMSPRALSTTSP
nr:hypothetical protein [Tanacetum cinerariifolium]